MYTALSAMRLFSVPHTRRATAAPIRFAPMAAEERGSLEVEGTHRAFGFQAGRYVDVLSMARLRRDRPAAD